ncbi:unnamed protein product [Leptosia nina]|uniref:Uncharacterized protein n=1 Tax=Leptosia nina TaxID=320188 RepID=A0AAV1J0E0_9NEOP
MRLAAQLKENITKNKSVLAEVPKTAKGIQNDQSVISPRVIKKSTVLMRNKYFKCAADNKKDGLPASPKTDLDKTLVSQEKPSKIPRRIFAAPINVDLNKDRRTYKSIISPRTFYKSSKKTLDDSAIKKIPRKNSKLNTTL